jgi:hypothetical protein
MQEVIRIENREGVPAVAEGLSNPFFTIAVSLLAAFDSHIDGAQMVL